MGASAPESLTLTIRGPIKRTDLPGLCERVCTLLSASSGARVTCHVEAVEADAVAVDALCRLQVAARRCRCRIQLRGASPELLELAAFMGLENVFG